MYYSSRLFLSGFLLAFSVGAAATVKIPDTGQNRCYSDSRAAGCPSAGGFFLDRTPGTRVISRPTGITEMGR
jgi:hypothetical protein